MRKILVVNTAGLGLGGITTHMLNFLGCLSYDDFQIDIIGTIILDHNIMERFQEIGCNVIILKNRKKNLGGYIRQLSELMKKEQYDVIHVHGNSATMVLELRLAETNGIPKRIAHCHNTKCSHRLVNEMLPCHFLKILILPPRHVPGWQAAGCLEGISLLFCIMQ